MPQPGIVWRAACGRLFRFPGYFPTAQTKLGEYVFVAEAAGGSAEELEEVTAKHGAALQIRVLGLYETKWF